MDSFKNNIKIGLIVTIGIVVTILHYNAVHSDIGLHILHRELYFLPIILAGFWFGLKAGLVTSLIVSVVYAPHVFLYQDAHGHGITVLSQIAIFILVGVLLGWLVDRQREQYQRVLTEGNLSVLGRAAATVGYEMQDMLDALHRQTNNLMKSEGSEQNNDIQTELSRLNMMVDILKSYVPNEEVKLSSHDLNVLTEENIRDLKPLAQNEGIAIEMDLDQKGCPIMADTEGLRMIMVDLIKNAMDVSSHGQIIKVRTVRDSHFCQIIVEDQGPGIHPEHISKIFTPFFTTKKNGQGLALAVCKKTVSSWGGEIKVQSPEGKGAVFIVTVPRDVDAQEMKNKIEDAVRTS